MKKPGFLDCKSSASKCTKFWYEIFCACLHCKFIFFHITKRKKKLFDIFFYPFLNFHFTHCLLFAATCRGFRARTQKKEKHLRKQKKRNTKINLEFNFSCQMFFCFFFRWLIEWMMKIVEYLKSLIEFSHEFLTKFFIFPQNLSPLTKARFWNNRPLWSSQKIDWLWPSENWVIKFYDRIESHTMERGCWESKQLNQL